MPLPHFHLTKFGPTQAWPEGGWSLYQITGDQIAERTIHVRDDSIPIGKPGRYSVAERHPWPGFIACYATLPQAVAEIERLAELP